MTNYNERLDEILAKHGAEPGKMTYSLKQAILCWVADEVIGKKPYYDDEDVYADEKRGMHSLIDRQINILAQYGYKGDKR